MAPSLASITSTRYAIVVDAGSSGSRLQIYSWQDPEAERRQIVVNVKERWRVDRKGKGRAMDQDDDMDELHWRTERALRRLVKVEKGVAGDDWVKRQEPGLSSQTPETLQGYFAPLLDHALEHIPPSQHATTPIYILATAGMRLLPDHDREAILDRTCKILKDQYPFQLDSESALGPCGESVRVISGEEEGMWGWVAVNYLMDGFGHAQASESSSSSGDTGLLPLEPLKTDKLGFQRDVPPTLVDPAQRSPTFGFLDMGGASTQIAFSPTPIELEHSGYPAEELRSVSLRLLSGETVEWPVFVASWLGFGTNRVREKYEKFKIHEWQETRQVEGGTLDLAVPSPAASDRSEAVRDPCLPANLYLESTSQDRPSFLGTGSFSQCLRDLQPLLESSTPCPEPHGHCLFAGLPTPHIDFDREDQRGFIGISEYWYTAQQVLGLGGVWDWAEWEKGMSDFCARDWEDVQDVFAKSSEWKGTALERSRLQMQCFKGAWISNVLHEGIGIPRIVDSGGNQTLTGGDIGDTNEEAERRAKKKGLKSSHFQSLDTVGETAISWTLGKMVIEASKGVKPHGHRKGPVGIAGKVAAAWSHGTDRLHDAIGLPVLEDKMAAHGIDATWAYLGFWMLLLAAFLFSRKRSGARYGRRRKASDAASWARSTEEYLKVEEQSSTSPTSKSAGSGSLRHVGNRLSSILRQWGFQRRAHEPRPRSRRHSTAPPGGNVTLSDVSSRDGNTATYSSSSSLSLPPSPRADASFFTPAYNPSPSDVDLSVDQLSTPTSRGKMPLPGTRSPSGRRPNSLASPRSGTPNLRGVARRITPQSHGGWNDPPSAIFEEYNSSQDGSSVLIPPAASGEIGGMLSRNSSRISLVDAGSMNLNSRPVSRGPSDMGAY